ncbi:MAG: PEP-CTERM sorting domain-containing protein [Phycisphaerae bacterium]|nr:PEP-CTERM sorting domain-containing protein [Phycisphaerae bacterium]
MTKAKFVLTAALLVSTAPTMASMTLTDDFNGGFDQSWGWVNGGGDGQAAIYADGLRLYSPGGYNDSCVGGYVAATYGLESFVSATVNANGAPTGNDQGVLARLQGANQFYGLNYDPFLNKIELIYNHGDSFTNLSGLELGGGSGMSGQAVELRLQVMKQANLAVLIGQAWDPTGTILLGQVQQIVDGVTEFNGTVVPVLGAGVSGVYAALNLNEYMETGGLSPLDARMDDFLVRTDTLQGDANLDGIVNELDYDILAANWGVGDIWSEGDFTFDGTVDEADLAVIQENWGGSGSAPTGVPEPATLALLAMGAPMALRYSRRK